MTAAETPRADERATLTEAERDDFRRNLRQNLGYRAFVIEDTMVGHVERIVTDRLAAAVARAEAAEDWKAQALPVISGLQVLGKALGLRLGTSITGPDAAEAARSLKSRAEAAEAEAHNVQADYDRRGERLWRLAALTGYAPTESDNDATAEHVIASALGSATTEETR